VSPREVGGPRQAALAVLNELVDSLDQGVVLLDPSVSQAVIVALSVLAAENIAGSALELLASAGLRRGDGCAPQAWLHPQISLTYKSWIRMARKPLSNEDRLPLQRRSSCLCP